MCCPLQDLVQASKGKNQGLGLQHRVKPTTNISRKLITIMTGMLVNLAIYLTKVYYVYKPFIFNTKNAKSAVQLARKRSWCSGHCPAFLFGISESKVDSRSPPLALHSCFKSHASPCSKRESRTVCCEATVSEHTQFPGASALQAWEQLLMAAFRPECRQLLGQSKKSSRTKSGTAAFYRVINKQRVSTNSSGSREPLCFCH